MSKIGKLTIISPKECHQNIKEIAGKRWKSRNDENMIKDKKRKILLDKVDIMKRWRELSMKCTRMVTLLLNFWNPHLYQFLRN